MAGLAASGVHRDPILARIGRIQRTARLWSLVRGWLAVALVGLCLLLAGVLLDHALTLQRAGRGAYPHLRALGPGLLAATRRPHRSASARRYLDAVNAYYRRLGEER